ncbi:hypothetical protein D3M71_08945 [Erwinia billingiae]|nr:hypothetical protein [Erwinia billingiae]
MRTPLPRALPLQTFFLTSLKGAALKFPNLLKGDNLHHEGVFLLHRYAETLARRESFQRISNLSGKRTQVK